MGDALHDDERAMLDEFLERNRHAVIRKVGGLSTADATREATATGVTLLGTVKHLAWDERIWFGYHLRGDPEGDLDATTSFAVAADDTIESAVEFYRHECDFARGVVAETSLDTPIAIAHDVFGTPSLRWVIMHMIEETARHAGHIDILREMTDGAAGY